MADAVLVVLLLAFIWAAVLVPPAAGARASREADFLGSIRPGHGLHEGDLGGGATDFASDQPRFRPALTANARRRQVLGGLVVAMGATLVLGLLPTFRLLLVVHLFLVNSSLAYIGLLVHVRDEQAARTRVAPSVRARPVVVALEPAYAHGYDDDLADEDVAASFGNGPTFASAYADYDEDDEYDEYDEYGSARYYGYDDGATEDDMAYVDDLARPA